MKVLLIGGAGSFLNKLIVKLKKEGHRVYLITGQRYKDVFYEKVFQRYDFPYDGETLNEIFKSVRPDATIFAGAYDTNFNWAEVQAESMRYLAGMTNMLMSYAMTGTGRFIYLSSEQVYSGDHEQPIVETEEANPVDFARSTLLQAEELCLSYRKNRELDIVTLRLDRLCTVPENRRTIDNVCAEMCMEALEDGRIHYQTDRRFAWTYESDAIEYIYRVMVRPSLDHACYHISSSEALTEKEMAEMVKAALEELQEQKVEIVAETRKASSLVLSNSRYAGEIGLNFFCNNEEIVKRIVSHMAEHRELFLSGEEKEESFLSRLRKKGGWLFGAMVPFVENLICFIPFFMLNNRAVGSAYFSKLDFYLLYVLLFAIVHGQQQATFSAILAVGGYIFREMYTRTGLQVLLDYNTYVWVAQLFILGLVVGYMRDKFQDLKNEGKEERLYLSGRISDVQDISDSNVRVKQALENQIVNQSDSIGKIYDITSALDQRMPEEVLFYAADVLKKLLNTKEVAVYVMANAQYGRLFTATSETAKKMGYSIKLTELGEMYETLLRKKVFINRKLDDRYPLMANAVYDGEELQLVVMVWGIPWEAMTLGTANVLSVASSLIQNSVLRAGRYLQALEEKRYHTETGALETEEFENLRKVYTDAAKKQLTEFAVLQIQAAKIDKTVVSALYGTLRSTDYVGIGKDGGLYVLLANTKQENAVFVMERISALGYENQIVEA